MLSLTYGRSISKGLRTSSLDVALIKFLLVLNGIGCSKYPYGLYLAFFIYSADIWIEEPFLRDSDKVLLGFNIPLFFLDDKSYENSLADPFLILYLFLESDFIEGLAILDSCYELSIEPFLYFLLALLPQSDTDLYTYTSFSSSSILL
jgi:hypothetical protein